MDKKMIPPAVALLGGVAGYALRRWQLSAGFEPETGLAIPGAPAAVALILCTALVALLAAALCRNWKGESEYVAAFKWTRGNTLFAVAAVVAGLLFLMGAVAELPALRETMTQAQLQAQAEENLLTRVAGRILPPIRVALGVGAAPCAILWGRAVFRGEGDKMRENLGLLELCLLFCVCLISDYQNHSADPVVMDYVYAVLAMVCVLLALYYLAGYSFQDGKPRRCVFFCMMGCYFCLVALADGGELPRLLDYGGAAVFLLAHAAALRCAPVELTKKAKEEGEEQHG